MVVVLVGTNNTTQNAEAEDIADALVEIVRTIRSRLPESYIILIVSIQYMVNKKII